MRKLMAVVVILGLLLGLMPVAVSAQTATDLSALARYFPEDAPMYIGFRTDDALFDQLDAVLRRVAEATDEDIPPASTLLDLAVFGAIGEGKFEEDVRSWLGDTGAVVTTGLPMGRGDSAEESGGVIALSVTDRTAAEAFVNATLTHEEVEFEQSEVNGGTLFSGDEAIVLVFDDVLFLAENMEELPSGTPEASLADNAAFQESLSNLPNASYDAVFYGDFVELGALAAEMAPEEDRAGIEIFMNALGKITVGTQITADALLVDIAQRAGDTSTLEALGFGTVRTGAVNPDFSARIPANAVLSIHGHDLGAVLKGTLANLTALSTVDEFEGFDASELPGMNQVPLGDMNPEDMDEALAQMSVAFTQATGLNLEEDVLNHMNGDFTVFVTYNPTAEDMDTAFDLGVAIEVTDAAAAESWMTGLRQALEEAEDAEFSEETVAGVEAVSIVSEEGQPLYVGTTTEVFAVGTLTAFEHIVAPDESIADNEQYVRAQTYLLSDAQSVVFVNLQGLGPLAQMAAMMSGGNNGDGEMMQAVLGMLDSLVISSRMSEDGLNVIRLAVPLTEE